MTLYATYGSSLPSVSIYAAAVKQVLTNIINNAIEAMPDGGELRVRTYSVSAHNVEYLSRLRRRTGTRADEYVVVSVRDSGCGIPDSALPRIFEYAFTTKGARDGHSGGSGLGLTHSKTLMELHNGDIEVNNNEGGKGVTARITFPSLRRPA